MPFPSSPEEQRLERIGRALIFVLLAAVCIAVAVNNGGEKYAGIPVWYVIVPVSLALLVENAVKIWGNHSYPYKIVCYVIDILLLLTLTIFTDGNLISTLYMVILSEFYLGQNNFMSCVAMGASSIGSYLITLAVSGVLKGDSLSVTGLVSSAFNDLILLALHFVIFNFAVRLFRKNKELNTALAELNETNAKLMQANEELKEIAVLEERQRIAKDIHDTVGHAITAVIMQTEAARLVMDSDPEDAKRKVSTANLQAKNALEQLRDSVHLLSGSGTHPSVKSLFEDIVHASSDGTGIVFRTEIEDISLGDEEQRFLCNSLKEGISNGLRHGGATAFFFSFSREGESVKFLLSDNGKGAEGTPVEGFGLRGMRTRAEALGGKLEIETEQGEGFLLRIILPYPEQGGQS